MQIPKVFPRKMKRMSSTPEMKMEMETGRVLVPRRGMESLKTRERMVIQRWRMEGRMEERRIKKKKRR